MLWWSSRRAGGGAGGIHKQFTRGQASRPCLRSCGFSGTRIQASLTQKAHLCPPDRAVFLLLIFVPWPRVAHEPLVSIYCDASAPVGTGEGRQLVPWPQSAPSALGQAPKLPQAAASGSAAGLDGRGAGRQDRSPGLLPGQLITHPSCLSGPCAMLLCLVCLLGVIATHSNWR